MVAATVICLRQLHPLTSQEGHFKVGGERATVRLQQVRVLIPVASSRGQVGDRLPLHKKLGYTPSAISAARGVLRVTDALPVKNVVLFLHFFPLKPTRKSTFITAARFGNESLETRVMPWYIFSWTAQF